MNNRCCFFRILNEDTIRRLIEMTERYLSQNFNVSPRGISFKIQMLDGNSAGSCERGKNLIIIDPNRGLSPMTIIHEVLHCFQHESWNGTSHGIHEGLIELLASYIIYENSKNQDSLGELAPSKVVDCMFKDRNSFCFLNNYGYIYLLTFWSSVFIYLIFSDLNGTTLTDENYDSLIKRSIIENIRKLFNVLLRANLQELPQDIQTIVYEVRKYLDDPNNLESNYLNLKNFILNQFQSHNTIRRLKGVYKEIINGTYNVFDSDDLHALIYFLQDNK